MHFVSVVSFLASGPFGGEIDCEKKAWSDETLSSSGEITSISLWYSTKIDGIQLKYGDKWAQTHGATDGDLMEYTMDPGTYIKSVKVTFQVTDYEIIHLLKFKS